MAQCFEHLIKINAAYFPQLRQIEEGAYPPSWRDHVPWLGRFVGSMVLRAVQPRSQRKFKAAQHVEPAASMIADDIIGRFTAHQREVIQHMTLTGSHDLSAIVITSPVAPVAFYSALDAFMETIRETIHRAAPGAEEAIKYQMPAFMLKGNLVFFAAYKNHIGFYGASGDRALKAELAAYAGPKGTLKFPNNKRVPFGLIRKAVKFRVKQNRERAEARAKKK